MCLCSHHHCTRSSSRPVHRSICGSDEKLASLQTGATTRVSDERRERDECERELHRLPGVVARLAINSIMLRPPTLCRLLYLTTLVYYASLGATANGATGLRTAGELSVDFCRQRSRRSCAFRARYERVA